MNMRAIVFCMCLMLFALFATAGVPTGETGFLLSGTAQNSQDPENPANDVIRIDTTPALGQCMAPTYLNCPVGTVSRRLNVQIAALDNMLEFKSYFLNRSCGGGSPRMQLSVDLNGDGVADGNLFAYTFPSAGCPPNRWQYNDMTDEAPRWDASQLVASGLGFPSLTDCTNPVVAPFCVGGQPTFQNSGYVPFAVLKAVLTALFPNHKICSGALVDDSGWFPAAAGVAYYDIISMGRATWEDHEDTVGRGFARGCGMADHDDSEVDGDKDHDYACTPNDQTYDQQQHSRWNQ
ncbi:MAG: hypothetical protein JOZ10_18840 [Acidobacteria bacterium]|nr:hypothetical protein [Acidobacteriota bacterium]MBV9144271.1 hypothetical protein [Acidobacteriota bacterium]MBV9436444.1 hypothetical protein [Acidobacteriota bacterium]